MKSYGNRNRSITPKPMKKYSSSINSGKKKLLANWVQFVIPKINTTAEEAIKTGLLPYKLLQSFIPNFSLKGFHLTPNSSQAYNNILLINNFLYQEFPNSELPSPSEILKKGSSDCWVLIHTIFKNLFINEMRKSWDKCFDWYFSILNLYEITPSKQTFIQDSLTGVYLSCILNCYTNFTLSNISKSPSPSEISSNISQVFEALKGKIFLPLDPNEFSPTSDEDMVALTMFSVFKNFRFEVPTLPTKDKIRFKGKPQLILNTTDSLLSLSIMESLEYSKSTILSKDPSESQLPIHKTPKWNKEKILEIITDDSTGYSMQPYEISYDTVSIANTSYTKKNNDRLQGLEKTNVICERKCMFLADMRTKREKLNEVPSLKKLRLVEKKPQDDVLCFLITPRLLKMLKPNAQNLVFNVAIDVENFTPKNESYVLEWKDFSLVMKGKINLTDISHCESAGRVLHIRTYYDELAIQCLDEKEAKMYAKGLVKLSKPKTLFSRDVSCNELINKIR